MSDILKMNSRLGRMNVKLKNIFEEDNSSKDPAQDFLKKQIELSYKTGFEEGTAITRQKAEDHYKELLEKKYSELNNFLSLVDNKIAGYDKEFEILVLDTAFTIAGKILKREIDKESIINDVLKESMRKILGANNIIVRINPSELEMMNEGNRNMLLTENYSRIRFEPDEKIEKGGCFVESEIGNVDGRISSQLSELKKQLEADLIPENSI